MFLQISANHTVPQIKAERPTLKLEVRSYGIEKMALYNGNTAFTVISFKPNMKWQVLPLHKSAACIWLLLIILYISQWDKSAYPNSSTSSKPRLSFPQHITFWWQQKFMAYAEDYSRRYAMTLSR